MESETGPYLYVPHHASHPDSGDGANTHHPHPYPAYLYSTPVVRNPDAFVRTPRMCAPEAAATI